MRMFHADRVTAVLLLALGVSMGVGGWTMDRLEFRNIHPGSIPGLVPMILGGLLALCAVLLWHASTHDAARAAEPVFSTGSWGRLSITGALCIFYALVLVGWLPFLWATALFVTAFGLIFSWPTQGDRRTQLVTAATVCVVGFGMAVATSLLFEKLFLVRLP